MTGDVRFPQRVEFAFGADLTAAPSSWTWTDVSDRLMRQGVSIRSGRSDETSQTNPRSMSLTLKNKDGWLTPRNPSSQWYPNVRRNTPMRYSVRAGSPHLTTTGTTGSRARTIDDPSLDIVGDWFMGFEIEPPLPLPPPGANYEVAGKFNISGNQRSILSPITASALPWVRWSTNGTNEFDRFATAPLPQYLWGTLAWAFWLDVSNAGNHIVTFYAARTLDEILADPSAHVLGEPVVTAGVTSVFASTANLDLGDVGGSGFSAFPGKLRRFQARSGDATGTIVANPDFTTQAPGVTSFTDSAGRPWTVNAPAVIDDWQTRFAGQVDGWAPVWPDGTPPGAARVQVSASGVLRRLSQGATPLESALFRRITSPEQAAVVDGYWPMEDGRDATQFYTPIAGERPIAKIGGLTFASDGTLPASKPLPTASANDSWWFDVGVASSTSGTWEVTWLVNIPTPSAAASRIMVVYGSGSARSWVIQQDSTNVTLSVLDADDVGITVDTMGWNTAFQYWSILRLEAAQNGGNIDYALTWIPLFGPGAGGGSVVDGSFAGTCGRVTRIAKTVTGNAPPDGLSMGHVALTSGTVNSWLAGADQAFNGETAGARIVRLCDEQQLSVVVQGDIDDTATMGPQQPATLVELLRECAAADLGMLVEQRHSLGIGYRTRASLYNQESALELSATPKTLINPFEPALDDQRIRNDVTVARTGGSSVRVTDDVSIDEEDRYDEEETVNVESDGQLIDQAGWRLHRGTWPEMRYSTLSLKLGADVVTEAWLHAGPGDVVEVSDLPDEHPVAHVSQIIEGTTDDLGSIRSTATFNTSPAGIWEVGVRDDPDRSRRDSGDSTLNAAFVAGTNTSMTVAIPSGLLWTTAGGDFPFELDVGGAQVTVTAISGATSPQTFTVSTTIGNGVARTIPAGTAVRLWRPTVRAL